MNLSSLWIRRGTKKAYENNAVSVFSDPLGEVACGGGGDRRPCETTLACHLSVINGDQADMFVSRLLAEIAHSCARPCPGEGIHVTTVSTGSAKVPHFLDFAISSGS